VPVFLELPGVRRAAQAQARRLLCFLQLRQRALPAGSAGRLKDDKGHPRERDTDAGEIPLGRIPWIAHSQRMAAAMYTQP
jgi:hypothetical protein